MIYFVETYTQFTLSRPLNKPLLIYFVETYTLFTLNRPLDKCLLIKNYYSYFSTQTCVVGTQKKSQ